MIVAAIVGGVKILKDQGYLSQNSSKTISDPLFVDRLTTSFREAIDSDDHNRAYSLAKLLVKRDPRKTLPRWYIVSADVSRGNTKTVKSHFIPLLDIDRKDNTYIDALIQLSVHPDVSKIIDVELEQNPVWGGAFLRRLARTGNLDENFPVRYYKNHPHFQKLLLQRLVDDREYARAYSLFLFFTEMSGKESNVIFNPNLKEIGSSGPFNWKLNGKFSHYSQNNGIEVYLGRNVKVDELLSQIVPIQPGGYRFQSKIKTTENWTHGRFVWTIKCLLNSKQIYENEIDLGSTSTKKSSEVFEVTEACGFGIISLSFSGSQDSIKGPANIQFVNLEEVH